MTHDTDDRDLKRLFAAMRQEDERRAPAFEAVLARPARPRRMVWTRLAVAAVLLVGLSVGAFFVFRQPPPEGMASITAWQSPTAGLLRAPVARATLPTASLLTPPVPRPRFSVFDVQPYDARRLVAPDPIE